MLKEIQEEIAKESLIKREKIDQSVRIVRLHKKKLSNLIKTRHLVVYGDEARKHKAAESHAATAAQALNIAYGTSQGGAEHAGPQEPQEHSSTR